nr:hypothetical protein CFP56_73015 [Quercus suber]
MAYTARAVFWDHHCATLSLGPLPACILPLMKGPGTIYISCICALSCLSCSPVVGYLDSGVEDVGCADSKPFLRTCKVHAPVVKDVGNRPVAGCVVVSAVNRLVI